MIDRMLALAAVEFRQALEVVEPVDLACLLRESVNVLQPRMVAKELKLQLDVPGNPAIVQGDRFLLGQAISNLLDNALEFSPPGGTLRVVLGAEPQQWRILVGDDGPGVPTFALERVFERFYSLPRPDGARSSGIGLSFVREVAMLHGGTTAVANNPVAGATAELVLPRR